ncbi:hypothetical protein GM524_12440 [Streptococcus pneumoniae]|nr:hypothetical protein [Streptococcus pneumoniae]
MMLLLMLLLILLLGVQRALPNATNLFNCFPKRNQRNNDNQRQNLIRTWRTPKQRPVKLESVHYGAYRKINRGKAFRARICF